MVLVFKLLFLIALLLQSTFSVPVAYQLDANTYFCVDSDLNDYSARLFRQGPATFFSVFNGNGGKFTGIVYDPKSVSERSVTVTLDLVANTVLYTDQGFAGGQAVWTIQATSSNVRTLCLWTDLASAVSKHTLAGEWAVVNGNGQPAVNYCFKGNYAPIISYYFTYPDSSKEIGSMNGNLGLQKTIFYGSWTSSYLNCLASVKTNYSVYVLDPPPQISGVLAMKHIGYSTNAGGATIFEQYDKLGSVNDCSSVDLYSLYCTGFVPTENFGKLEHTTIVVIFGLIIVAIATSLLMAYALIWRPRNVSRV